MVKTELNTELRQPRIKWYQRPYVLLKNKNCREASTSKNLMGLTGVKFKHRRNFELFPFPRKTPDHQIKKKENLSCTALQVSLPQNTPSPSLIHPVSHKLPPAPPHPPSKRRLDACVTSAGSNLSCHAERLPCCLPATNLHG